MKRGMSRGQGNRMLHPVQRNSGISPFTSDLGLQDIDMELELLKRKREIIEKQQLMLSNSFLQRNDFESSYNESVGYDDRSYDDSPGYGGGGSSRKRTVPVWENELPAKRFSGQNRGPGSSRGGSGSGRGSASDRAGSYRGRGSAPSRGHNKPFGSRHDAAPSQRSQPFRRPNPPPKRNFNPTKVSKPFAKPQPLMSLNNYSPAQLKNLVEKSGDLTTRAKPAKRPEQDDSFVLRSDCTPSRAVTGRLELALGSILKDLKLANPEYADIFSSFASQRAMKQVLRDRIKTAMIGKTVGHPDTIKSIYQDLYPESIDIIMTGLEARKDSPFIPIPSDNPEAYFRKNMNRLFILKMEQLFQKMEELGRTGGFTKQYDRKRYRPRFERYQHRPKIDSQSESANVAPDLSKTDKTQEGDVSAEVTSEVKTDNTNDTSVDSQAKGEETNQDTESDNTKESATDNTKVSATEDTKETATDVTKESATDVTKESATDDRKESATEGTKESATTDDTNKPATDNTEASNATESTNIIESAETKDSATDNTMESAANNTIESTTNIQNKPESTNNANNTKTSEKNEVKVYEDDIISTEKYVAYDRFLSTKVPQLLKKYAPRILKLLEVDNMYRKIEASIREETRRKLGAPKTEPKYVHPQQNPTPRAPIGYLPYFVKLMGKPNLPKRKAMESFFDQFKPKIIKKHRNIHNLLFVGFADKEPFEAILAANGTMIGRFTLDIMVSERNFKREPNVPEGTESANNTTGNDQVVVKKEPEEGSKETGGENMDTSSDRLIESDLDEQISDLLSSIRNADENTSTESVAVENVAETVSNDIQAEGAETAEAVAAETQDVAPEETENNKDLSPEIIKDMLTEIQGDGTDNKEQSETKNGAEITTEDDGESKDNGEKETDKEPENKEENVESEKKDTVSKLKSKPEAKPATPTRSSARLTRRTSTAQ